VIFNDRTADVAERFLKRARKILFEGISADSASGPTNRGAKVNAAEVVIGRFNGQATMLD